MATRPGKERKAPGAPPNPLCTGHSKVKKDGVVVLGDDGKPLLQPCGSHAIDGGTVCWTHGGASSQVAVRAAVRAEVMRWGLGDLEVDPGEVLMRLVSQAAARAEFYSGLLAEAYAAAERLKAAHEAHRLVADTEPGFDDDEHDDPASVQSAKEDLDRIFNLGGVAALVGNTYSASNTGSLYVTGEAIRGLAKLEADERDRCASMAAKAIAAGLAERQVRLEEKRAAIVLKALDAALDAAGVPAADRGPAKIAAARHLMAV